MSIALTKKVSGSQNLSAASPPRLIVRSTKPKARRGSNQNWPKYMSRVKSCKENTVVVVFYLFLISVRVCVFLCAPCSTCICISMCLFVCACAYISVSVCKCVCLCVHTCAHARMCVFVCVWHVRVYIHGRVRARPCVWTCACAVVCVRVCVFVRVYDLLPMCHAPF